ncbi:MAG: hypothetical protein CVU05_09885 [Bacteroidetes bacterium HGW-Bacteroidetes-21]|nr:MAG: hypothetical protein CVU05_09885 [Bacteroidetes bacterium HGW-Bacteroidetes-21]
MHKGEAINNVRRKFITYVIIKKITIDIINKELKEFEKPNSYNGLNLPFNLLNDRAFEILLYQIFKDKIDRDENNIRDKYDYIDLMQGVGEKGRDCILTKNGVNVGVIQCKKIAANISKPQFIKELLKFLLFAIKDKTLISSSYDFTYYFSVSTGLAGTTKELIRDFNTLIFKEKDIELWTDNLTKEYKQLNGLTYKSVSSDLSELLKNIKVERILPQDIEYWLSTSTNIQALFFNVKTVTDNTLIEKIENKYLIPLISILNKEKKEDIDDFNVNFKEYLSRSYNYYSSARTLVFGNQQKKLEDFYYPLELAQKNIVIKTKKYPDDFLPKYKKAIIVDSGGMGKSTIMKWLFINAIKENKGIPIFVELRLLSEKNTLINEIISQINPLDKIVSQSIILKMISKGNFIFFFDGYDEIKISERKTVTKDISEFISKANKNEFIITSRPENVEGIFGDFQTFHIKPLTNQEAYKLIEKIGDYNERSKALIKKLQESDLKNIKEFLKTPLLISLLYKKFEYRESIPFQKQEFYFEVFEALFKAHDLTKGTDYYIRPKESNLSFSDFYRVLRTLGFRSIQDNELEYNKTVLLKLMEDIKSELPNINYDCESLLNDLTLAVPLFQKEGLKYKWAHKSIQEYFAAEFICMDTKDEQVNILLAIYNGERLMNLLHVLDLCYEIDPKSFRNSILYSLCKDFLNYCQKTFNEVINKGEIPISEIRDRQFRMYIDDNYLIHSDESFKKHKDAKSFFIKKVAKIRMTSRVSADNYYIGTVKKRENVRKMLHFLLLKRNPLIKDIVSKDFMYNKEKEGYFRKSGISLFNGEIETPLIFVDDKIDSPVNNPKYFKNVSTLMKGSYLDYSECEKLVESVETYELKKKTGKKYTTGF